MLALYAALQAYSLPSESPRKPYVLVLRKFKNGLYTCLELGMHILTEVRFKFYPCVHFIKWFKKLFSDLDALWK